MPGSETSSPIMFYYTYVLENLDGDLYVGLTANLKKRLKEHNRGLNFSTKSNIPWHVIYCEACLDKEDAKRREKYLKTSQGARLLKRRLKEYFYKKRSGKIS